MFLANGFWQDFFVQFSSDIFGGLVLGTLVVIWLHRRQQKEQEAREEEAKEREALARKGKLLRLLREELQFNRDGILESRKGADRSKKRSIFVDGLKVGLWEAFSDSGELRWLEDPHLVDSISYAYHYVRRLIFLENLYLEAKRPQGLQAEVAELRTEWIAKLDPGALEAIEQALREIDKSSIA